MNDARDFLFQLYTFACPFVPFAVAAFLVKRQIGKIRRFFRVATKNELPLKISRAKRRIFRMIYRASRFWSYSSMET